MRRQRGVSLSGLMMAIALIVPAALLGMKVIPSVIEYYQILKVAKSVAQDAGLKEASVGDIRTAFARQKQVADFTKISSTDLEVTKEEGAGIVIAFAYEDKIPLFANVSLAIDYEGSSAK